MAAKKKISLLNDDFDLSLVLKIVKRSLPWAIFLLISSYVAAALNNRYTVPIYQSNTIVKIGENNNVNKIMQFENIYEMPIAGEIELIKSKTLFKRALKNLPLKISYYSEGSFLNTEQYRSSYYEVLSQVKNQQVHGIDFHIKFLPDEKVLVNYVLAEIPYEYIFPINSWASLPGVELKISCSQFGYGKLVENPQSLYFTINSEDKILANAMANFNATVINEEAKTLDITFVTNHPLKCADLANSVALEFLKYNVEKKGESANQIINFTNSQIALINEKLNEYSKILEPYGIDDETKPAQSNPFMYQSMQDSRNSEIDEKIQLLRFEKEALKDYRKKIVQEKRNQIYAPMLSSPYTAPLIQSIQQLQLNLSKRLELQYQFKENSGPIKELDYQIELQKKEIYANIDIAIEKLEDEYNSLLSQKTTTVNIASDEKKKPLNNSEILQVQRMYEISQDYYSKLLQKKSEYEMVKAGFVSNTDILESAYPNSIPIEPQTRVIYLTFISIGFLISLAIIVTRYLMHNTISTISDIVKYTNDITILGMIPEYKETIPVSQLLVDKNPKSLMTEAFRSVRSNLQFLVQNEGSKVIAVTSTISGEGKTFVAINLGGIIAFSGKKVIILDLDMRKPKTHIGFNAQNTVGMSTILIDRVKIDDAIQRSTLENLHFITAGPIP
ncbi:MAG: GumC family protein, partial [Flavobacteriales bacterium]